MVRSIYFALALTMGCVTAWALLPSTAAADESAGNETEAKRLFDEGLALAKSQRWGEALASFRGSAVLVPRASTSYNIANALYRLNRPVDGLAELDRYDDFSEVRYNYAAQQRGESLRDLLEEAVAELRLTVTPLDALLYVDGRLFPAPGFERRLRLNPGAHSLRVTHDQFATSLSEVHLERGGRESLKIGLEPLATAPRPALGVTAASATSTEPQDDRDRFVKRPGFWVMIGAIVVVGVGTGVAVAMVRRDDAPQCGTTGDCATTSGLTVTSF
jgi:hypothetical protein